MCFTVFFSFCWSVPTEFLWSFLQFTLSQSLFCRNIRTYNVENVVLHPSVFVFLLLCFSVLLPHKAMQDDFLSCDHIVHAVKNMQEDVAPTNFFSTNFFHLFCRAEFDIFSALFPWKIDYYNFPPFFPEKGRFFSEAIELRQNGKKRIHLNTLMVEKLYFAARW